VTEFEISIILTMPVSELNFEICEIFTVILMEAGREFFCEMLVPVYQNTQLLFPVNLPIDFLIKSVNSLFPCNVL
jgi:hypothetical protein